MVSSCGDEYTMALACVPGGWPPRRAPCVERCVGDVDPDTPELDPQCVLRERTSSQDEFVTIPTCVAPAQARRDRDWDYPPGAEACVEWLTADARPGECIERGYNLGYAIHRTQRRWEGSCLDIVCAASEQRSVDCPGL